MKFNQIVINFINIHLILIFSSTFKCSLCPYFCDPELSIDAFDSMLACINDDFNSLNFFKLKLKKENKLELVILIDVISRNKFTLTELKRNKKGKIESKIYTIGFSFENRILYHMKKYYQHFKCDIYVFHYMIDCSRYLMINRVYFGYIRSNLLKMKHKIQLLPASLKILSKEKSKCMKYFHLYFDQVDYIISLFDSGNLNNIMTFSTILEKYKIKKIKKIKKIRKIRKNKVDINKLSDVELDEIYNALLIRSRLLKYKNCENLNDFLLALQSSINLFKLSKSVGRNLGDLIREIDIDEQFDFKILFDQCEFHEFTYRHSHDTFFFPDDVVFCPNICVLSQCIESIYKSFGEGIRDIDRMLKINKEFIRLVFLLITQDIGKLITDMVESNIIRSDRNMPENIHDKFLYCSNYKKIWLKTFRNWLLKNSSNLYVKQEEFFRLFTRKYLLNLNQTSRNNFEYSLLLREYLLGDFL